MEAKRTMQKSTNQRGRISNVDKPFTKLTMREDNNKFRDEKEYITTISNEIQRIIREYFERLYSSKLKS
jgi:hypothetical protein